MFLEQPRELGSAPYMLANAADGRVIAEHTEPAFARADRRRGLLGRDHLAPGHAMLIAPCSSIHTWFMRFPIDAIFVTRDGLVVKLRGAIEPWRMVIAWGAYAVIEMPVGSIERSAINVNDRLELRGSAKGASR